MTTNRSDRIPLILIAALCLGTLALAIGFQQRADAADRRARRAERELTTLLLEAKPQPADTIVIAPAPVRAAEPVVCVAAATPTKKRKPEPGPVIDFTGVNTTDALPKDVKGK